MHYAALVNLNFICVCIRKYVAITRPDLGGGPRGKPLGAAAALGNEIIKTLDKTDENANNYLVIEEVHAVEVLLGEVLCLWLNICR